MVVCNYRELDSLHEVVERHSFSVIKAAGHVSLCFDAWTDTHGLLVLGWVVKCPNRAVMMLQLEHVQEAQSNKFIASKIDALVDEGEAARLKVASVVSAGAANCQKELKLAQQNPPNLVLLSHHKPFDKGFDEVIRDAAGANQGVGELLQAAPSPTSPLPDYLGLKQCSCFLQGNATSKVR